MAWHNSSAATALWNGGFVVRLFAEEYAETKTILKQSYSCYLLLTIYHRNILTKVTLHKCMSPLCLHKVTQRTVNYKNYTAEPLKTKTNQNKKKKIVCIWHDCAFHPGHKCWSMDSVKCSWTKSNVNVKRKNLQKRKRLITVWVACGT